MAERILTPIDQKLVFVEGWSNGFSALDVDLRADNHRFEHYIDQRFLRGLPRLEERAITFTEEFDRAEIPEQFTRDAMLDLSLGSSAVRLTTGDRIKQTIRYDERDTLHETADSLARYVWVFGAAALKPYTPPEPVEQPHKARRRGLGIFIGP